MFGYIVVNQQEMKFKEFDEIPQVLLRVVQGIKRRSGRKRPVVIKLRYDISGAVAYRIV